MGTIAHPIPVTPWGRPDTCADSDRACLHTLHPVFLLMVKALAILTTHFPKINLE